MEYWVRVVKEAEDGVEVNDILGLLLPGHCLINPESGSHLRVEEAGRFAKCKFSYQGQKYAPVNSVLRWLVEGETK